MKIKYYGTALIVIVVLFGGYGIFKYTGHWDDTSNKVPTTTTITENNKQVEIYDPNTIKGSSKFIEISEWFDIPLEDLGNAFNVPNELLNTFANKDLEVIYSDSDIELGNESVKLFVAFYTSFPYEITEETFLPTQAVEVLKEKAELSSEQLSYINSHKLDLPDITIDKITNVSIEIKGQTTFQEVIDAGVDKATVESILGVKLLNPNTIIRDYCIENGLEFSNIKNELIDAMSE